MASLVLLMTLPCRAQPAQPTSAQIAGWNADALAEQIARGVFSTFETEEGVLVVLGPAHETFAFGPARALHSGQAHVAVRDVSSALPGAARALARSPVTLITQDERCASAVTSLVIASIVVPDFGHAQEWADDDFDDSTVPVPWTEERIAENVVRLVEQSWVVGIAPTSCRDVVAATLRSGEPVFHPRIAPARTLARDVRRALRRGADADEIDEGVRASLEYVAREEGYSIAPTERDIAAALARGLTVEEFVQGGRSVVVARLVLEAQCGAEVESFVFERVEGRLVRRGVLFGTVDAVIDIDGDGVAEIMWHDGIQVVNGIVKLTPDDEGALTEVSGFYISFQECLC